MAGSLIKETIRGRNYLYFSFLIKRMSEEGYYEI
jgi:hypothetical protein